MLPSCGCSLPRETVIKNEPNSLLQKSREIKGILEAMECLPGSCKVLEKLLCFSKP